MSDPETSPPASDARRLEIYEAARTDVSYVVGISHGTGLIDREIAIVLGEDAAPATRGIRRVVSLADGTKVPVCVSPVARADLVAYLRGLVPQTADYLEQVEGLAVVVLGFEGDASFSGALTFAVEVASLDATAYAAGRAIAQPPAPIGSP